MGLTLRNRNSTTFIITNILLPTINNTVLQKTEFLSEQKKWANQYGLEAPLNRNIKVSNIHFKVFTVWSYSLSNNQIRWTVFLVILSMLNATKSTLSRGSLVVTSAVSGAHVCWPQIRSKQISSTLSIFQHLKKLSSEYGPLII